MKSHCIDASASTSAGSCSENHSSSNYQHAVILRAHGKAKQEQMLKQLKANSPCFHEVQDLPGLHALLLSVIFMGQEMEFDFVEAMFVLLALHTQGLLYINFLQDLQKHRAGSLLLWWRHFIYFLQFRRFPQETRMTQCQQADFPGGFVAAAGQKDSTLLHVRGLNSSDNAGRTASPPTWLLHKRLRFLVGQQLHFTDPCSLSDYLSSELNLNSASAAFSLKE